MFEVPSLVLILSMFSRSIKKAIPVQSDYIPKLIVFFVLSIIINVLAMVWFVQHNCFKTKGYLPKLYNAFGTFLNKVSCLVFHNCKRNYKNINCINCLKKSKIIVEREKIVDSNLKILNHFYFLITFFLFTILSVNILT